MQCCLSSNSRRLKSGNGNGFFARGRRGRYAGCLSRRDGGVRARDVCPAALHRGVDRVRRAASGRIGAKRHLGRRRGVHDARRRARRTRDLRDAGAAETRVGARHHSGTQRVIERVLRGVNAV